MYLSEVRGWNCVEPLLFYISDLQKMGLHEDFKLEKGKTPKLWFKWLPFLGVADGKVWLCLDLLCGTLGKIGVIEVKTSKKGYEPIFGNYHGFSGAFELGMNAFISHLIFDEETSSGEICFCNVSRICLTPEAYGFEKHKKDKFIVVEEKDHVSRLKFRSIDNAFGFEVDELFKVSFKIHFTKREISFIFEEGVAKIKTPIERFSQTPIGEENRDKKFTLYGHKTYLVKMK